MFSKLTHTNFEQTKKEKPMKNKFIALIALLIMGSLITGFGCYQSSKTVWAQSTSIFSVPYGAELAKTDTELTLTDMLTYAIEDEYLARARYLLVLEKFGQIRPFVNIINAEETHINQLIPLFNRRNIAVPTDNSKDYVIVPANIRESLEIAIQGEIDNIAMYNRFLQQNLPSDVRIVFTRLRNASQNHLRAFNTALQFV